MNTDPMQVDLAMDLAVSAHKDQVDDAGKAYILHPLRLMMKFEDVSHQVAALLHDVLEDTGYTREYLIAAGIHETTVEALVALKRVKGESYSDYITRLSKNPIAVQVKMADIEDNINVLRLGTLTDYHLRRVRKYHEAWSRLSAHRNSSCPSLGAEA
tara:strand:+ start:5841 stop:6311 length:471 start_codon:yes stop_codon:yes gene_type:complete